MAKQMRLIKKYPNRRLYDTQSSTYITLADVKELVVKQEEFQVVDAKSGEDLTRSILLQIILEEENAGHPLFTHDALTQLIRSYSSAMQGLMGNYLEKNIQAFMEMQRSFQDQSRQMFGEPGKSNPDAWTQLMSAQAPAMQNLMNAYLEQSKQVLAQMQNQFQGQARSMFQGFPFPGFPGAPPGDKPNDK